MKLALFGGSFDPVHLGHDSIVKMALSGLDIDKLIIKTDTNASEGSFFMTGFDGFRKVPMTNGVFECKFNPPLNERKVLMSLKVDHHRSTKLLIKDTNAK